MLWSAGSIAGYYWPCCELFLLIKLFETSQVIRLDLGSLFCSSSGLAMK
jgi:hypothetical protein